ncbi:hypothetical protein ABIA24_004430 [Sinorhizobium fredii]|uniref:hypothetical protein n=1 Tax=Rhizobium fredii TaxID=380 RepID=UPI00351964B8
MLASTLAKSVSRTRSPLSDNLSRKCRCWRARAVMLASGYTYPYNSEQSALQLSLTHERLEPSMKDAESCKGLSAFNDLADNYGHHLPGNPADLFDWLLEQPQDMVLMLLAFGAAHSVNAVEKKFTDRKGIEQANQLGRALKVHMPDWFETTGDSYFKHVNRTTHLNLRWPRREAAKRNCR